MILFKFTMGDQSELPHTEIQALALASVQENVISADWAGGWDLKLIKIDFTTTSYGLTPRMLRTYYFEVHGEMASKEEIKARGWGVPKETEMKDTCEAEKKRLKAKFNVRLTTIKAVLKLIEDLPPESYSGEANRYLSTAEEELCMAYNRMVEEEK